MAEDVAATVRVKAAVAASLATILFTARIPVLGVLALLDMTTPYANQNAHRFFDKVSGPIDARPMPIGLIRPFPRPTMVKRC